MKKIITFVLVLFATIASAQKISFNSTNAKQTAGIHTQFNCIVEFTAKQDAKNLVEQFKATPGVLKVDAKNATASTVELIIITDEKNNITILQNALKTAGISKVTYDKKEVSSGELNNVIKSK
ncbi:MAG: hypothetical protein M3R27_12270 [Bacteroidota bacterium]|nr:hypothetical protein [Bacteroidota bacterium]